MINYRHFHFTKCRRWRHQTLRTPALPGNHLLEIQGWPYSPKRDSVIRFMASALANSKPPRGGQKPQAFRHPSRSVSHKPRNFQVRRELSHYSSPRHFHPLIKFCISKQSFGGCSITGARSAGARTTMGHLTEGNGNIFQGPWSTLRTSMITRGSDGADQAACQGELPGHRRNLIEEQQGQGKRWLNGV